MKLQLISKHKNPGTISSNYSKAVNIFLLKAIEKDRIPLDAIKDGTEPLLMNLGLITKQGQLTNAAILLFGKNTIKVSVTAKFQNWKIWKIQP